MSQLEDEISDVLNKAIRGLGKTSSEVAQAAGIDEVGLNAVLGGSIDKIVISKLAAVLNLDPEALLGLPKYQPNVAELAGVQRWIMPYRAWSVNAWMLEMDGVTLLFDTGWNRSDVLSKLHGVQPNAVGNIRIQVIDLSGHCVPTASYLIKGFEKSLWVVGDAIFAGSMGGCKSTKNFELAVANLRNGFEQVDADCLILPGHGPMTSVELEKSSNPFRKYFS